MDAAEEIRDVLRDADATLVEVIKEFPLRQFTYEVEGVTVQLWNETGAWRVNIGLSGDELSPASFWLAALAGDDVLPEPPVTDEDLGRVAARLPELLRRAPEISDQVSRFGEEYSRAMRQRLE